MSIKNANINFLEEVLYCIALSLHGVVMMGPFIGNSFESQGHGFHSCMLVVFRVCWCIRMVNETYLYAVCNFMQAVFDNIDLLTG